MFTANDGLADRSEVAALLWRLRGFDQVCVKWCDLSDCSEDPKIRAYA